MKMYLVETDDYHPRTVAVYDKESLAQAACDGDSQIAYREIELNEGEEHLLAGYKFYYVSIYDDKATCIREIIQDERFYVSFDAAYLWAKSREEAIVKVREKLDAS